MPHTSHKWKLTKKALFRKFQALVCNYRCSIQLHSTPCLPLAEDVLTFETYCFATDVGSVSALNMLFPGIFNAESLSDA